ncbi:MAG: hypothetical protein ACRENJ_06220 [Candidatus Eiseniibacteriota bacterium]
MSGVARRARPRRRSVNLRRLRWVLIREAAWMVLREVQHIGLSDDELRRHLAARDTDRVEYQLTHLLMRYPYARVLPALAPRDPAPPA